MLVKSALVSDVYTNLINMSSPTTGGSPGLPGVFGALAYGGYHPNRFIAHDIKFSFGPDDELPFRVIVQSLNLLSPKSASNTSISLSQPFTTMIDSTRPHIYLPELAYNTTLEYFNLTYDSDLKYIPIPNDQHQKLVSLNASLQFELTDSYSAQAGSLSGRTVTIVVPYKSLALILSFPFTDANEKVRYLAIEKGVDSGSSNNFVLGRAFLQDAYMLANYEAKEPYFKVHAIDWKGASSSQKDTVMLIPPANASSNSSSSLPSNKTTVIAGAVSGGLGLLLAILLCFCIVSRKRKQKRKLRETPSPDSPSAIEAKLVEADSGTVHEMPSRLSTERVEMDSKSIVNELPDYNGTLGGHYKPVELDPGAELVLFEMEGSPGIWSDEKGSLDPVLQRLDTSSEILISGAGNTSGTGSSATNSGVSSLGSLNPSSGVSSLETESATRSRLPKVTLVPVSEPYTERKSPASAVPASPIPQTPLEYYGGHIPEHRLNKALQRLRAAERGELPEDRLRSAGVPIPAVPKIPANASTLPAKSEVTKSAMKLPEIVTIAEASESAENTRANNANDSKPDELAIKTASQDMPSGGLAVPNASSEILASPIPQTPLEYYGKLPGSQASANDRGWVGRAPHVPTMNLIPATPSSPNTEAQSKMQRKKSRQGRNSPEHESKES
jgi:hypothetical protein